MVPMAWNVVSPYIHPNSLMSFKRLLKYHPINEFHPLYNCNLPPQTPDLALISLFYDQIMFLIF